MNQIQLPELVAQKGQAAVAEALGVTPAAIHKAIRAGRQIIVTAHDDGTYTAEELRPFPSQKNVA
ncbi:Cro/CI family transcriptional regulator [Pseudomonas sp. B392_1p]|uniref:Cro/CI family transcriptional regulator n=1 Tax=Pseudomonas sp. B392_1p TaxID=3457507 RepID=UPI003FD1D331